VLAQPWQRELSSVTGEIPAFLIILFIALIPGFLNAHIVASILLDSPPPLPLDIRCPPITVLMAAYNEAENIRDTFRALAAQDYPAAVEIIVVDDGSTD
jgi:biofilm PGA synthesis N-glycosyltransferase PgaC